MTILLEGPDGAGKTTLAKFLADKFELKRIKNGAPEPGADLSALYQSQLTPNTVIDRAWPSELVYASLLKRKQLVSNAEAVVLFGELGAVDGQIVVCLPPFAMCEAMWHGREGELFQDRDILAKAWQSYKDLIDSYRELPQFLYAHDWTQDHNNEKLLAWLATSNR